MKFFFDEKRFSESTGKLHIYCPYRERTGINVHVVIKGGYCYRSRQCMVVQCKFNSIQLDIDALLSLVW
jgi:hypothetical protein